MAEIFTNYQVSIDLHNILQAASKKATYIMKSLRLPYESKRQGSFVSDI